MICAPIRLAAATSFVPVLRENNPADAADCRRGETNVPIDPNRRVGNGGRTSALCNERGCVISGLSWGQMLTEREIWIGNCLAIRRPDNARLVTIYLENGSAHR